MLRLCVLNSVAPKLRPTTEGLDSRRRHWFSDGYRTSTPGTTTCRETTDCERNEICQSGYCTGIKRIYGTHGLYYGNEYRDMLAKDTPRSYLEHGNYARYQDFFYDYTKYIDHGTVQRPLDHVIRDDVVNRYGYDHDYDYA